MAFIDWSENLSVKVNSIDVQHKKLVELINKLHDASKEGKAKEAAGPVLKELINYTATHFDYEEKLFSEHGYPESATHSKEHKDLVVKVLDVQKDFDAGKLTIGMSLMSFLKDWLNNHILKTDKKYADFFVSKGVK